jgi:quinol monooxygenase YgiN
MHIVTVRFTIHPDLFGPFLAAMRAQRDASLQHSVGCRRFDIAHDGTQAVFLYEEYDAPADFMRHLQTSHFQDFAAITADMVVQKVVEQWQSEPATDTPDRF